MKTSSNVHTGMKVVMLVYRIKTNILLSTVLTSQITNMLTSHIILQISLV